jgi:hypothetical protein
MIKTTTTNGRSLPFLGSSDSTNEGKSATAPIFTSTIRSAASAITAALCCLVLSPASAFATTSTANIPVSTGGASLGTPGGSKNVAFGPDG